MVTVGASSAAAASSSSTRPSDARRERLGQQIKVPTVSNFFPIQGYYDAAAKVYDELQQTSLLVQTQEEATMTLEEIQQTDPSLLVYDTTFNAGLDMCYLLAKRYCLLCVDEIPNHNYYNTSNYQRLKHQHVQQMKKVVQVLERVVEQMDVQEQILRILQEQKERTDQYLLLERHRLVLETSSSASSRQIDGPDRQPTMTPAMTVQESALEKLKRLLPPPPSSTTTATATTIPTPTTSSTRYRLTDDDENDNNDDQHDTNHAVVSLDGMQPLLPPALQHDNMHHSHPPMVLPPPTPPSYDAVITAMQNRPARAATTTTTTTTSLDTSYIRPPPPEPTATKKETIRPPPPMRQQQEYYKARYMKYQQMGKIQISSIDTYQGRISASTNGCTVISALIVARHLQDPQRYTAISNATIQNVIDVQCGPILRTIRNKLGLGGHALIIPSDVHDHLVDAKILLQEQFTGAAGGNIMSPLHYQEFLQLLSDTTTTTTTHQNGSSNGSSTTSKTTSNGKAGATLFFREHVISIVKSIDPNTKQSYYDFIDSMPGIMQIGQSRATRTRCTDMESLQVLLLWYASRKFSDANCNYIDRNPWDDNTADLDPRVFQGFVWSS